MLTRVSSIASGIMLIAVVASAQPPAPQPVGIAEGLRRGYAAVKTNLTQSAEKMPEVDYASKPSTMPEVRTYGALFGHVANFQYNQCAQAKGVANPNQGTNLEQTKTTKADIVKALADSFAFCDDAFANVTDQSAAEMITGGRGGQQARAVPLIGVLTHGNEMYGITTVYLRGGSSRLLKTAA